MYHSKQQVQSQHIYKDDQRTKNSCGKADVAQQAEELRPVSEKKGNNFIPQACMVRTKESEHKTGESGTQTKVPNTTPLLVSFILLSPLGGKKKSNQTEGKNTSCLQKKTEPGTVLGKTKQSIFNRSQNCWEKSYKQAEIWQLLMNH